MKKEEALVELYNLIDFYYENRDRPVTDGFNFHEKLDECCEVLEVDKETVTQKFKLNTM